MLPVMAYNLLQSIELLASASNNFAAKCIEGIKANEERCKGLIEESLAMCTALAPAIGYEAAAKIAKDAYRSGKTVREIARTQRVLPEKRLAQLLDPWRMTKPGGPVGSAGGNNAPSAGTTLVFGRDGAWNGLAAYRDKCPSSFDS